MMFGYSEGRNSENFNNIIIYSTNFSPWKFRNKIKYNRVCINAQLLKSRPVEKNLKDGIRGLLKIKCNATVYKIKLNIILNNLM